MKKNDEKPRIQLKQVNDVGVIYNGKKQTWQKNVSQATKGVEMS